ncbi:MAG: hypothetical protein ACREOH_02340, partial [Candidatus Entotheonellia bacterium]
MTTDPYALRHRPSPTRLGRAPEDLSGADVGETGHLDAGPDAVATGHSAVNALIHSGLYRSRALGRETFWGIRPMGESVSAYRGLRGSRWLEVSRWPE